MPHTIKAEDKNLISIDASGELNDTLVAETAAKLMEATDSELKHTLLVRLSHMELGSLHPVASKWSRSAEFFALQKRISKVAVLTDQPWIRQSAKMQAVTLPDTELRVFDVSEGADARLWLETEREALPA